MFSKPFWRQNVALLLVGFLCAAAAIRLIQAGQERTQKTLEDAIHIRNLEATLAAKDRSQIVEDINKTHDDIVTILSTMQARLAERTADRYTATDASRDLKRLSGRIDQLSKDLYSRYTTHPTTDRTE